jgi:predicted RNA binding protein YcfA (HicA-like mRNA interferase family)
MSKHDKILQMILRGTSDSKIKFTDLCTMLKVLGFQRRIKGDHHIYSKEGVDEIINLQPRGNMAKPYQVKQVRTIILKYKLEVQENEI